MKRLLALIIILLIVESKISFCQSQKISISVNNESLANIIQVLSKTYHLRFAYDNQLLENTIVTKKIDNLEVFKAIDRLLEGTELTYHVIDKTFVISPKKKSLQNKIFSVSGIIKDKNTGETLPYANIFINETNKGTSSNKAGFFSLSNILYSDTTRITIHYLGYRQQTVDISSVNSGEKLLIELSNSNKPIDGVTVGSNMEETIETGEKAGQLTINPNKLVYLPNIGEVDVFRSLQLLPGIFVSNETSVGLSIRGGTADQNLLLFDGFSLYKQDHFFGMFSAINSNVVKNIQVYKGGYEAKYGGKVSGVIEITGKSGNTVKPAAHIGFNMFSANLLIEVPLFNKKGSVILAGRRSYTDILQTSLYKDTFNSLFADDEILFLNIGGTQRLCSSQMDPIFYFYDLNSKITYNPSERDIVSFSLYSSEDELYVEDIEFDYFNHDSWGNKGASLKWNRQWNEKFCSETVLSRSDYFNLFSESYFFYDSGNALNYDKLINENDIDETRFKIDNEWHISSENKIEFGLEWIKTGINFVSNYNDTIDFVNLLQNSNLSSGYFQYTFLPLPKIKLISGVRYSYFEQTNKSYIEPRLSLYYNLSENFYLKAAYGKYHQFVSRMDVPDQFGGYVNSWLLADDFDIPVISADHYIVGLNYKKGTFNFDVEFYKNSLAGLTELRYDYYYDSTSYYDGVFHKGEAEIKGIDMIISNKFGPFTGWISYSISKNERTFNGLNNGLPFHANNDKRHVIKLTGLLKMNNWDFSSTFFYSSGTPYSKPSSSNDYLFYFDPLNEIYTHRLPDYHRLDISATYNYSFKKVKGNLGMSIINVYNKRNIKSRMFFSEYDEVSENFIYVPVDIKHLGFTPSVFLNINF